MLFLETDRLALRPLAVEDDAFMLQLLNEPSFLRFIGDRGVRTPEAARRYIQTGPVASYQSRGFGLLLATLKEGRIPIGICGLLKRDSLKDVDLGFAFLPTFWSKGYAFESASAVIADGRATLGLHRIVAVTNPDNESSITLLGKLGFRFEHLVRLAEEGPPLRLFARDLGRRTE